jgi:hypothetical protein
VQHEDEHDVEQHVGDRRDDQADHGLAGRSPGTDDLLEAERRREHRHEGEHDHDVAGRLGSRGLVGSEHGDELGQQEEPRGSQHRSRRDRAPERERGDVLDLAGLRRIGLGGAEQPRDQRAAADAEHASDRHDETEERDAERDRREHRGVALRADEPGVDDVVERADDQRGGHRHAEVHEGPDDRRRREIPAVGAGRGCAGCLGAGGVGRADGDVGADGAGGAGTGAGGVGGVEGG